MSRTIFVRRLIFYVVFGWAAICFSLFMAAAASPDARQIVQQVYNQQPKRSVEMRASFEVYNRQGRGKKKEFLYRRLNSSDESKSLVVFTAPEEVRSVELLSIQQAGNPAQQYIYTPSTQRVRSVVSQERSSRFLGTDFSYEEIGDHVIDDFTYRLIGDQEVIDGRKSYKIEARPVESSRSQYQYLYLWVAQDAPVVVFEQMFGAGGALTRTLHATDLRRADGLWGARRTEISTPAEGSRTVLTIHEIKFNLPFDEAQFAPQTMAAPDAAAHK